jgi:hypothetical protein
MLIAVALITEWPLGSADSSFLRWYGLFLAVMLLALAPRLRK